MPKNAFEKSANLTYLHLEMNNLTSLKGFKGLTNLEFLDLSFNQISQIEKGTFDHFQKIKHLDLSKNYVTNLSPFISPGLSTLQELDLSGNKLNEIEPGNFAFMQFLRILILEENLFESFDFEAIPIHLETLNLHKNYINFLMPAKMEKSLTYLDLSFNNIDFLDPKIFAHFPKLQFLRLANNMLKNLDFYGHLPLSLRKLDLRTNLIETLKSSDADNLVNFGHLNQLEEIFISQNLWICSCNFRILLKFVYSRGILKLFTKLATFQVLWGFNQGQGKH